MPSVPDPELARARAMAKVLDRGYVDPILGFLLPGAGDLIGSAVGLYVVGLAFQRKVAPIIIARMLLNLALDAGLGAIPLAGDLFDAAWKANDKNVALLEDRTAHGRRGRWTDWLAVLGAFAVVGLAVWGIVALFRAIW